MGIFRRQTLIVACVALSGCGAFAFDNYNRRSSTVAVMAEDCRVEVHRGELSGGPAIGQGGSGVKETDIRPDIKDAN